MARWNKSWRETWKFASEILLSFVCINVVVTSLLFVFYLYSAPENGEGSIKRVYIEKGTPFEAVVDSLSKEKIISSPSFFTLLTHLTVNTKKIKAGEYIFPAPQRPLSVLRKLVKGEVATYYITIPEGSTIYDIAQILGRYNILNKERFLHLASSEEVAKTFHIDSRSLEGYLFPDTYLFTRGMDEKSVLQAMVDRFKKIYTLEMDLRRQEVGISRNKLITIASIIEKETSLSSEMPIIASIIYSRLKKNMRLQMDPTVIYGLHKWKGKLTREDLKTYNEFNTYMIHGLPPSPISNPGKHAIQAALHPSITKYLYFVSKNDGSHYFSRSLRQHINAVNRYQKRKKRKSKRRKRK